MTTKTTKGAVITVRGEVQPDRLGAVLMHEHLQSDIYDWDTQQCITEEAPPTAQRRQYLLDDAVPLLKTCGQYGCHCYLEATPPPWRAWPSLYVEVAEAADMYIVMSTGFYREMEMGTYWVKEPEDRIWPTVINTPVEGLAEICIREIVEGIHGTDVRAGAIKLGTSAAEMTELEAKCFSAGAVAQQATGVHITTHCTALGAETTQLRALEGAGVDLSRVVIGHTARHLMDPQCRKDCIEWMKRGANFLPTNLGVKDRADGEKWRPLVEAIKEVFDADLGDKLALGLDSGYCSESGPFAPMSFLPPAPFTHMFTHTLPLFREFGLDEEAIETMLVKNPARILPVA